MSVNKKILLPLILIAIFFLFYSSPFLYGQDETTISDTTLNNVLEQARAYKDQDNYKMALDEYKKNCELQLSGSRNSGGIICRSS